MEEEVFVPGRLCLLGEHTDWICGYRGQNSFLDSGLCLVCATNEGIYAKVHLTTQSSDSGFVYEHTNDSTQEVTSFTAPFDVPFLEAEASKEGSFFCYVAGAAASVLETCFEQGEKSETLLTSTTTIKICNYKTTLPMGKGLSSSAAISVLVVKSFAAAFNLQLNKEQIMAIAYRGERKTKSLCGMMDFCVVMGQGAVGLMVMAEDGFCRLHEVPNAQPLYLVAADLNAPQPKDTVEILRSLNECFPFPRDGSDNGSSSSSDSGGGGGGDDEEVDGDRITRGRYHMHDYAHANAGLCMDSVHAIETGDTTLLAACMKNAQALFDRGASVVCPAQLTAPYLHKAITLLEQEAGGCGVLAVKGVGSQGDGSVQVLCRDSASQLAVLERLAQSDIGAEGFCLTLPASAAAGSGSGCSHDPHPGGTGGHNHPPGGGGSLLVSVAAKRVVAAVLVVSSNGENGSESGLASALGMSALQCTQASLLACGIGHVHTVSTSGEEEEGAFVSASPPPPPPPSSSSYRAYLENGRLHTQCTLTQGVPSSMLDKYIVGAAELAVLRAAAAGVGQRNGNDGGGVNGDESSDDALILVLRKLVTSSQVFALLQEATSAGSRALQEEEGEGGGGGGGGGGGWVDGSVGSAEVTTLGELRRRYT